MMAGLGLDFLTQVVNVHWESGLAVEFGPHDEDAEQPQTASNTIGLRQTRNRRTRETVP
jgi:hypothetical protein